jgi:hypothetical protein
VKALRHLATLLLGAWLAPTAAAELAARDALTGAPVQARVEISSVGSDVATGVRHEFASGGRSQRIDLAPGRWRLHAEAAGYRPLDAAYDASTPATTLLLDPIEQPTALVRVAERAAVDPTALWLHGYVRDARDGAPLVGARVQALGRATRSDADGYFELQLDAPAPAQDALPAEFALQVQAVGFPAWERTRLLHTPGAQHLVIALGGDTQSHAAYELGVRDRGGTVGDGDAGNAILDAAASIRPTAITALPPLLTPPASIRVGFADASCTTSCCTAACTNTCTMSLETYVARGLDNEWIPSWNTQSLRAGSIAYRSYGAWRVANPIRAAFDICSSACCQVNDNTASSAAVSNAVARTPGIVLTYGSAAAASEYSSENNGWDNPNDALSCTATLPLCGDGLVGDASKGWPCMVDDVAAGHGCFGHGRGMSQWGTQRWAIHATTPKTWPWIVNHYFNDNGNVSGAGSSNRTAVMTSPLALSALSAQPFAPAPGSTLRLGATAHNAAGAVHAHILVGASLYRSGVGYLDDAAHDAAVTLAAEAGTTVARDFLVPMGATAGRYDLLMSLYLDVDENGAITAGDFAMALVTLPSAVEVVTDRIFADGFGN